MSEDCSTCKYNEINEQDLPCRECLNSFCGVPFNSPTKYELADKNTMSLREEIAALRTELAEKDREIAAIRELMNCYNVGGWTDSTEPMKRALQAEAELAELRAWKDEQLQVESSWDVQQIAKEMSLQLGVDIRNNILPYIQKLKKENSELRNRLKPVEEVCKKWDKKGDRELLHRPRLLAQELWQAIEAACEKGE